MKKLLLIALLTFNLSSYAQQVTYHNTVAYYHFNGDFITKIDGVYFEVFNKQKNHLYYRGADHNNEHQIEIDLILSEEKRDTIINNTHSLYFRADDTNDTDKYIVLYTPQNKTIPHSFALYCFNTKKWIFFAQEESCNN